ncbi:MAG: hypothetical protein KAK04_16610, partial [Cyclobacteriaceae bacterium]|nr:hypothetical protein [Cyclobacteriaceae bacterium]
NVKISIDDVSATTLQSSPYTYEWNTEVVDPGQHNIKAVATDNGGLTATSQIIVMVTADAPVVITTDITEITGTTATSGGNVTDDGGVDVTARGVVWGETSGPTLASNAGFTEDGTGTGAFTSSLTGLKQNKTYYVKAYAVNVQSIAYGTEKSFTTTGSLPIVEIGFVTEPTHESAKCSGEVTGDNGNAIIAKGVVWADTWDVTLESAIGFTDEGPGIGAFVSNITGLTPSTDYYVRAYATNSKGTAYAEPEISFSTGIFTGPPIVKTLDVTNIGAHVALSGFEFVDDGGNNDVKLGIVWGTSPSPDINNNEGKEEPVWGVPLDPIYAIPLTSLSPETTYYVRAYGQNPNGVGYGEEKTFTTKAFAQIVQTGSFTDTRDNTQYNTVTINNQTWMAQNLAYLPEVCASGATCGYWVYDYEGSDVASAKAEANYSTYGVLYNWEMAKASCPTDWHLPTHEEWALFEMNLGMNFDDATYEDYSDRGTDEGGKIKEIGTTHWASPNTGATNESKFTALPAGWRSTSSGFTTLGVMGYFWSSNQFWPGGVPMRWLASSSELIYLIREADAASGYSVRCVQD